MDGNSAARIVVNIEGQDKVALIDTGAGRCCMNEEQYRALGSPPLESQDVGFQLRTASGDLKSGMGFLTCKLQIGDEIYQQQFIVCRQLAPGIILGRDFLSRNQLGITWGPEGTLQLRDEQDPSVQTAEEVANPTVKLAANTVIPPRSLVLVTVSTILPPCKDKTHFLFCPHTNKPLLRTKLYCIPPRLCVYQGRFTKGITSIDKFRTTGCKITTGNSIRALSKGPIQGNYDNTRGYFWSKCRGTLGTWGSGGGSPKREWKRFYHFSRGYRSLRAH